jgi:opacity protein-like surface antigen
MKSFKLLVFILLSVIAVNAHAQDSGSRFSFELNAGPSFATQDLGGTDLKIGAGFETLFHYRLQQHVGVYAGWGWNRFGTDEPFQQVDADFEETGYVFGLEFSHPIQDTPLGWSVRAGGLYNHLEIENSDGDIVWDSGHGLGYHAGAGLEFQIAEKWSLNTIALFHSLSRSVDVDENNVSLDLSYISARVGIVRAF